MVPPMSRDIASEVIQEIAGLQATSAVRPAYLLCSVDVFLAIMPECRLAKPSMTAGSDENVTTIHGVRVVACPQLPKGWFRVLHDPSLYAQERIFWRRDGKTNLGPGDD